MAISPQHKTLSKAEALIKYTNGLWEQRLSTYGLEVRERHFPSPQEDGALVRKRTEIYRDANGEIVLARHIFERANRETSVNITYIVEDGIPYIVV